MRCVCSALINHFSISSSGFVERIEQEDDFLIVKRVSVYDRFLRCVLFSLVCRLMSVEAWCDLMLMMMLFVTESLFFLLFTVGNTSPSLRSLRLRFFKIWTCVRSSECVSVAVCPRQSIINHNSLGLFLWTFSFRHSVHMKQRSRCETERIEREKEERIL